MKGIGERCGSDPQKIGEQKHTIGLIFFHKFTIHGLGRILRYLATNHIFREITPDVFANNRLSSVLDTGKSVAVIKAE
jgi:hypothetical protein